MTDQATQQTTQTADATAQPAQPSFSIPEQYAQNTWAQNIKSPDDLWNQFANAQSLIGKRPAGIPTSDAPPEEWDKFYQTLGRPESPDKYGLPKIDGLPEGFDISPYEGKFKELAHKVGLSPKQAEKAWQEYMGLELGAQSENAKAQAERQAQQEKEFNDLSNKLFGDQFEAYSKQAQEFLGKALPPELQVDWQNMDNNTLAAFIQMTKYSQDQIDSVKKQYGGEDKLAGGRQSASMTLEEVRAELVKANTELGNAKVFSPEYKQIEENRNKLRETLSRMVNK